MIERLKEQYPDEEFLIADGFDDAIIGVDSRELRVIYDIDKMIKILVERDTMSEDDAYEFLEYNTLNAYVGDKTPIFMNVLY